MPRYRNIAEVTARPIVQVGWYDQIEAHKLVFGRAEGEDDGRVMTSVAYSSERTPEIGDYYVEYDDETCEVIAKEQFEREHVMCTATTE